MDLGELLFMYQGQAGCVSSVPAKKALQPSREAQDLLKPEDVSELFFGQAVVQMFVNRMGCANDPLR